MVRAFVRIVYHVRDAVSKMFRCKQSVVGSSPTVSISNFQYFPKTKKSFQEGECLSAIVRMGIFTFNGREERIKRLV